PQRASNRFRHDPPLLGTSAPLYQHFQIEPFCSKALQGILTNGTKLLFIDVLEQAILQVGIPEFPGVVVPEDPLDVSGGQDLPNHVEDGIIVQGISNLLELLQKPL